LNGESSDDEGECGRKFDGDEGLFGVLTDGERDKRLACGYTSKGEATDTGSERERERRQNGDTGLLGSSTHGEGDNLLACS